MGTLSQVVNESRRSLRIKENIPIKWQIKDSQMNGEGRVLNISASGMLLEAKSGISPIERCVFGFESLVQGSINFIPQEGRLVWSKKKSFGKDKMLCGIEFIDPSAEIVTELRERIQGAITRVASLRQFRSIIGGVLFITMIALSMFVVIQHNQNYENIQRSHQLMSSSYQGQTAISQTYMAQIKSTKIMLAEAEGIISSLESEKAQLQALVSTSSQDRAALDKMIAGLNTKNAQLSNEVASLKQRLSVLEDDIHTINDGVTRIALFKNKIRGVRVRMREIRRESHYAKIAAQAEKDRLGLLLGNNGYFVKDGKSFHPDGKDPSASKNVKIDVRFVK